jgi:hypothetical protein
LTVREHTESPAIQEQSIVRAEPNDAIAPSIVNLDRKAVLTSTRSYPRELYAMSKRKMLEDFFFLNGIGADRAKQITEDLVDTDHYMAQKGNAMIDRHMAENAELIARGGPVEITHTAEEKAEIKAEKEILYRQVFGEFFDAHKEYSGSYPQRRFVDSFSSELPEPLEFAARESIVQIMVEERSKLVSELESESAGLEVPLTNRAFNERVMNRSRSYLTPSQFMHLKRVLDNDLRRAGLASNAAEQE